MTLMISDDTETSERERKNIRRFISQKAPDDLKKNNDTISNLKLTQADANISKEPR